MIPNETLQTIESAGEGVKVVGNFRITNATQARILVSLSDKMYTRKELAFVREYSTNAADAHIVAGKPISDILVTMPTMQDLTFKVRDFGSGLTEQQIGDVYCVFGESTKRNSNEQNGLLGYGCKAGFAHADSFTVTSWINGEKSIYQCIKGDSTKLHSAILLNRSASAEPSGIEICIPVKQNSLWNVHREASNFYKYWPTVPTIVNFNDDDKTRLDNFRKIEATLKGDGWEVRPKADGSAQAIAYMGWVPYSIDWNVLSHHMSLTSQKRCLFELLRANDVTLYFKMGEVQFVDSRESLEYTDLTFKALLARMENIFEKIKDSIQEKFTPAPTIWDAKIIYNAIFGTGLLEVEKGEDSDCVEKIRILDGNLLQLERTFMGTFTWNGAPLGDACFRHMNRFDNSKPTEISADTNNSPIDPLMVTYRKKKKRAKINRCSNDKNNGMTASNQVAIVINDTDNKSCQSLIARYLIFRADSKVRTVHILKFADDTIKGNFFKEYNFYTVPVVKVSAILGDAKTWYSTNKVSRNYGGGGGGARVMEYMDIETGEVEENEVPIREMEEGGLYIQIGEGRRCHQRVMMNNGYSMEYASVIARHFKTLADKAGLDIDRVYIIGAQTKNAKWFKQAVESGDWTNVWEYVKENLSVDVPALVTASAYDSNTTVCKKASEMLATLITDKKSPMLTLINTVSNKNYAENLEIVEALQQLYLWVDLVKDVPSTIDFEKASEDAKASYPYLNFCQLNNEYYCDDEQMVKAARYINAMDLFVEWTRDTTPKVVETQQVLQTA